MNNNDVFKKLRVALQLRDDQIVEILQLVDFRISKAELGAFFRNADHPNYMDCGDQVLRNFLNGLIIHLRGTKEEPKNVQDVLKQNKAAVASAKKEKPAGQPSFEKPKKPAAKKPAPKGPPQKAKPKKQEPIVEKVRFNNGKNKKS
ncbi:DUF1456 family protein [Flavobacterium sp. AG291]|uniref:DUF1456 family protein n=1 Tax=Flavobacterium sp. AG291 TaxID=2184000 RepID=UPI000E0B2085|nr:DUF1456 family protein [Flavobacterium sp. AG291]RDI13141.1 uncharacterized protein DUF1456 [Flavobacterium sp. AG291]